MILILYSVIVSSFYTSQDNHNNLRQEGELEELAKKTGVVKIYDMIQFFIHKDELKKVVSKQCTSTVLFLWPYQD
jgi:hypothetical protein